ncbi:MAG: tRNA (N6-isopentenyl adenosine(37)-C2)-methylthiotransferase MiaB [Candidatus Bipolaricaulota bacterium]
MKACVLTWGCQLNQHRSEELEGVLAREGYTIVAKPDQADVVILNTCMVRGRAEEKAQGRLAQLAGQRRNGRPLIGVGGCMMQGRAEAPFAACPQAEFVFGTKNLEEVPVLVAQAARGERAVSIPAPGRDSQPLPVRRRNPFQAYVAVSEGCSLHCSYCVVPFVRGPLRSRPSEDIYRELADLAAQSYQEVTLLGQNVDAYGTDKAGQASFSQLLRGAARTGIPRVRFTSSHPAYITGEVLQAMAEEPAVCEHLHLAVQSGSDSVLQAMSRGYSRASLEEILGLARRTVPGLNLTTDVIVGFPGESENDFRDTLSLLEEAQFGTVYAASYSPRPHTPAAQCTDSVPADVKRQRLERVLSVARRTALELHRSRVGRQVEVLVEGYLPEKGMCRGKTQDFRTVLFPGDPHSLLGELVTVRITEGYAGGMRGQLDKGEG